MVKISALTKEQLEAHIAKYSQAIEAGNKDPKVHSTLKALRLEKQRRGIAALTNEQLTALIAKHRQKAQVGDQRAKLVLESLVAEAASRGDAYSTRPPEEAAKVDEANQLVSAPASRTQSPQRHKWHLRRWPSVVAVLGGITIVTAGYSVYRGWLGGDRSAADVGAQQEPVVWPFQAKIPDGFEFNVRQHREGRTFWILQGKKLGKARETILVVRSTREAIDDDLLRAFYWAAESSVAVPIGTSALSRSLGERLQKGQAVRVKFMLLPSASDLPVIWVCSQEEERARTKSPFGIPPLDLPASLSELRLEDLGRPSDFASGRLRAYTTRVPETGCVVAWAGGSLCANIGETLAS